MYLDKGSSALKGYDYLFESLDDVYATTVDGENVTFEEKMLDSFRDAEAYEVYDEESGETEEHFFTVPWTSSVSGLFYNQTKFENCGLTHEPRTTTELMAYCDTLKSKGETPLIYSSSTGYWEYLFPVWWCQYETTQGYDDCYNLTASGIISKSVLEQEGILESARVLQNILNPDTGYSAELVASMDFTKAQALFISSEEGVIQPNGDWLENEMKDFSEHVKDDFGLMKTPIISALSDKMSYWTLKGKYTDAVNDASQAATLKKYDEKLAELVDYVDGVTDTLPSGTLESDAEIVREARSIEKFGSSTTKAVIPAYASAKDAAKEFLKFWATDEAIECYLDNCINSTFPFEYDITKWAGYDDMSAIGLRKFEILTEATCLPYSGSYKSVYAGGFNPWRMKQRHFEDVFASPNKSDRQTVEEIRENTLTYWNDSRWNSMLSQTGY